MNKHVVVVASGETERRALPHLVSHLREVGITVEVRTPPRHRALRVDVVEKIIKAAWFASVHEPPAKFVVLVDVDQAATPDEVVSPLEEELSQRVPNVGAKLLFAHARQHLEAWYFADSESLRQWLGGRSLGSVDTSTPDAIQDPKRHLSNLLGNRFYTARTSEDIARRLDPQIIEQRSPSFRADKVLLAGVDAALGQDLQRPLLQSAQLDRLQAAPHGLQEDEAAPSRDRRAAQARALGPAGLSARGHGGSGERRPGAIATRTP